MRSTDRLSEILDRISHYLPTQPPIKDFIHHNTLHAFQNRPFDEAVRKSARLFGARSYMPVSYYLEAYRDGRISNKFSLDPNALTECRRWPGIAKSGIRSRWHTEFGVSLNSQVAPLLFRLTGNFLDQGIALWTIPHSDKRFYQCVKALVSESMLPLVPLSDPVCRNFLELEPEIAIARVLELLVSDPRDHEEYLLGLLLSFPGWAGMVRMIEINPSALNERRKISLVEFTAIALILEYGILRRRLGDRLKPLAGGIKNFSEPVETEEESALQKWQEALEWTYYESVIASVLKAKEKPLRRNAVPSVHVYFCIDDRECSVRRHLEAADPSVETFATAGFFGVDVLFQGLEDRFPAKFCPLPVQPQHVIREIPLHDKKRSGLKKLGHLHGRQSNTFFKGWLSTQILGFRAIFKLAFDLVRPSFSAAMASSLNRFEMTGDLDLLRTHDERTESGHLKGYSVEEMADRVLGVLSSTGNAGPLPQLVVLVGHGASSVNNPYFAAYDCGACSGKPAAPNARVFARMANDKRVRENLRSRGFLIEDDVHFLGAIHDTTRDEVKYFDVEKLPEVLQPVFQKFEAAFKRALAQNALERCRRFELVPRGLSPEAATEEVRRRSMAIFEPRPEYNHAANASCLIGRRNVTGSLEGRAFLNSYDPESDPDGQVLAGILAAVVPVCAGINLEYYFSRIDPDVYGAGTKLPHNIAGLIGVMNGVQGDLLTGLPTQMTEIHDPIRLIIVVEQTPQIVSKVIHSSPALTEWVVNDWVRLFCIDPATSTPFFFKEGSFVRFNQEAS